MYGGAREIFLTICVGVVGRVLVSVRLCVLLAQFSSGILQLVPGEVGSGFSQQLHDFFVPASVIPGNVNKALVRVDDMFSAQ